ncbi:PREDICTED: PAP-specific phosphatase HAL2-like [Nelumbo nucifera]|uniref:PAP-specific phosphatase HAL2-like n=2 Tax=Nelumbo nucifera TaxID=4432 RepID=A0A1U7ZF06_NELNU|nr:PREDICTED: PAP-specific phosphatase HAL2-like [Nelumbo nucifera]DAD43326.1 TPA_asm: hypothetical protein HUJ06_001556 [Nelumbo nucifera]
MRRIISSETEDEKLGIISSETEEYSTKLDVAVRIVQMACFLCQRVQESLISKGNNQVKSKDDNSLVTVAGHERRRWVKNKTNRIILHSFGAVQ